MFMEKMSHSLAAESVQVADNRAKRSISNAGSGYNHCLLTMIWYNAVLNANRPSLWNHRYHRFVINLVYKRPGKMFKTLLAPVDLEHRLKTSTSGSHCVDKSPQ